MDKLYKIVTLARTGLVPEEALCPAILELLKKGGRITCECGRTFDHEFMNGRDCFFLVSAGMRKSPCESISYLSREH